MSTEKQDMMSAEKLVDKLIELRRSCHTSTELLEKVNDWFITERFSKELKHLAFKGMYQYFDRFCPAPPMSEMVGMWHLCEMMDYDDTAELMARMHPDPKTEPIRSTNPVLA